MSTECHSRQRSIVAAMFGSMMTLLATGAAAGDLPNDQLGVCFANDSIVMGKRLAPRPSVIREREASPACRGNLRLPDRFAEQDAEVQRELDRIDDRLTSLSRDAAKAVPLSAAN